MAAQQNPTPLDANEQNKHQELPGSKRDLERRAQEEHELRERALDKTLEDSFPTSDPPSSIPDPVAEDSDAA